MNLTKEQYRNIITAWKQFFNENRDDLDTVHFVIYNILRGKDPKNGFTPLTSKSIPSKGPHEYWAFDKAKSFINTAYRRAHVVSDRWQNYNLLSKLLLPFGSDFDIELYKDVMKELGIKL